MCAAAALLFRLSCDRTRLPSGRPAPPMLLHLPHAKPPCVPSLLHLPTAHPPCQCRYVRHRERLLLLFFLVALTYQQANVNFVSSHFAKVRVRTQTSGDAASNSQPAVPRAALLAAQSCRPVCVACSELVHAVSTVSAVLQVLFSGPCAPCCACITRLAVAPALPQTANARSINAGFQWITVDGLLLQVRPSVWDRSRGASCGQRWIFDGLQLQGVARTVRQMAWKHADVLQPSSTPLAPPFTSTATPAHGPCRCASATSCPRC